MKLKALIFDVDGTLADTEKDGHLVAFNLAFRDAGLDWNWDNDLYEILLNVTGGKERIKYYIQEYSPVFVVSNSFKDENEFIAHLHKEKTKYYVELMNQKKIPLRTGVQRLLQEARDKGIILAISTTTTYNNVTSLLENTLGKESISWFKTIGAGDIVEHKKPASDIYEWVLNELNLSIDDCVAIEDSSNGVISSSAIGLKTIATINDYTKKHDLSKAVLIVDSLGDDSIASKVIQGNSLPNSIVDIDAINALL